MTTVGQVLQSKGSEVWTIGPEQTVLQALELMAEKNCGALLVVQGEDLRGIFSERDYARKVVLKGRASRFVPVEEIMTKRVTTVSPTQSIEECMALMTSGRFRHLPVMNEGRLIGLISIGDVVKAIISEQVFIIEQLETYISGSR